LPFGLDLRINRAEFMGILQLKKIILSSSFLFLALFLSGCLSPVKNEIPLAGGGVLDNPQGANDTRLIIYNDSDFLGFGMDGSGRINVTLNGQGVALVKIGEYAQVIVPKGKYEVDLVHLDMAKFASHHEIELTEPVSILEIFATPTSNRAFVVSHLPPDFTEKFKPVKNDRRPAKDE
jgi:hypothetical protein